MIAWCSGASKSRQNIRGFEKEKSMRTRMNVVGTGWTISFVLAMIYIVVVLACMLLVGLGTSGSVVAFLSGIEWNTIVGFEIGLLGAGMAGFVTAGIWAGAGYLFKHWIFRQADTLKPLGQSLE